MRIAAIDIGTNSIHMVIASADSAAGFEVVDREREVVQVGRGSFGSSRLRAQAIRDTAQALRRFVQLARRHQVDKIICTATAAVREAKNGGDFLAAARRASGIAPRVIPSDEEGRLVYLAVRSSLQLDDQPALMVDIGGGSVQLVVGDRDRVLQTTSAPLGALRLTETMLHSDPPTRRELQRVRRVVARGLKGPLERLEPFEIGRVYGSSGSIHTLAEIAHWSETGQSIGHINGHVLTLESLKNLSRRLRRMTHADRERLRGIDARRAEIIVAGALVLEYVLEAVEADAITLSDFGVREGLVTDYLASHAQELTGIGRVEDVKLRSVLHCLARFGGEAAHPHHIAALALALFDGFRAAHGLDADAREQLRHAALLHDVGAAIGYDRHAEHSFYVIQHANLRGFTKDEVERVANVARYHSKARPRKRDRSYRALPKKARRTVKWLAALLRIAEGLDRSHYQLIRSLRVDRRGERASIVVSGRREAQLEVWAARRRVDLLEKLLDSPVRIRAESAADAERSGPRHAVKAAAPTLVPPVKAAAARAGESAAPPRRVRGATG